MGIAEGQPVRGRARARPRCLWVALVLVAVPVLASDVSVTVKHHDEIYEVSGRFTTTAPAQVAWDVLSDYENIPRFVNSMKESQVLSRDSARVRLRQVATVGVFPARKTSRLLLVVEEQAPRRIKFHDTLGRDFQHYEGAWEVVTDSAQTAVTYTLDARPRSPLIHVFGRSMMSHAAQDLLKQVHAEMERRAAQK